MTPTISKELQEQIEREAEGYGSHPLGDYASFKDGATAYAHYKERFEQAKKALDRLKSVADCYSYIPSLNPPIKHLQSIINEALASWKEEGKEPEFEVITELWVVYNGRVPELEGFTREVKYKVVIDMGRVLRLLNDEGKEVLEDARYFTRIE